MSVNPAQGESITDDLNSFLLSCNANTYDRNNFRDVFMTILAVVAAAQKIYSGPTTATTIPSFNKLFAAFSQINWSAVNFPIQNTLLSQTYADIFTANNVKDSDKYRVLVESLIAFITLIAENPKYANELILRGVVIDTATTRAPAAPAVELNYRANTLKIFTPNSVAAIDLSPLDIVIYRGELIGGGFGPELWGLAYIEPKKSDIAHVLLETGEYVCVPATSLTLAVTRDYDTNALPPYLLACAQLYIPIMLSQPALNLDNSKNIISQLIKNFGSFNINLNFTVVDKKELTACAAIIDNARVGGHNTADGALKFIDIADKDLRIVITAQSIGIRPYISATLVQLSTGKIIMRLDTPREFTANGVYLFPVNGQSTAVIVA
jgi:hypothetical protein